MYVKLLNFISMINRLIYSALVLLFCFSCAGKPEKKEQAKIVKTSISDSAVKVLNYEQLKPYLVKDDDKTYVINFWATWCKPCVEELPAFEKLHANFKNKNVEVLLVSLDFPKQIKDELIPFIDKRNLAPEVIVLDDPDQNKWINAIDESWSGSIPATLIYNKNKRMFFEQSFEYESLIQELNKFIN